MINVQHLDFYYGNTQALYDVSVELPQGSITGLIGPNGAGKSTLMRCMAGLEIPTSGDVLLDGLPILDNPRDSFSKLGYLPDFFGLPDGLSVIQCLTYAAKSRGIPDARLPDLLLETVRLLNLEHKLYAKVSDLSRGQKQRVGIGQVIIHRPKFLLLDEPASGLDPEARHELSLLLLKLKDEGMSILVSSHILSELDEYCSHMLVIKGGRVQAFQSVNDDVNEDQTVSLQFVGLDESIFERVRNTEGVKQAEWNNHAVTVILDAGEEARAALLRKLFEQNLPLSEAAVIKASLLNSYQNSLNLHEQEQQEQQEQADGQ
ncbi:ABC transporter, ATP-binding protein [Neisseria sicca ATCC 29256]|jgi:ABC transporter, ATP-binding family protein|uniref:ABC transporter, ATP-binding protein n=1 Tax=Neisseria sicca ATCC 29256 TaxID=547045 RepID=C6M675_NEISI|nr:MULTISPECIES: ABC transporter ATP-binding protein [Neisseria]EET44303.1 ABC transporter, ATP-binding protein [Neisseria sicca ATCC 29256]QMT37650.1 ABC transporter ATP-binding protein [Neisseria sicca]